jgi:hypothetical protein
VPLSVHSLCSADPILRNSCPSISGQRAQDSREPLLYWRPIILASVTMALVATGLVAALAMLARGARADGELQFAAKPGESLDRAATTSLPPQPPSIPAGNGEQAAPAIDSPVAAEAKKETPETPLDIAVAGAVRLPACESYGTAVKFLSRPADAARQALREDKLLLVLHVSGNFEDAKFT